MIMSSKTFPFILLLLFAVSLPAASQAPADNENAISIHARLAQQYLRERRPDLAIPELQKIVDLDPNNTEARANLGVLLFFHNDYQQAVPHLRAALMSHPDLWRIQGLLGLAEGRLNDYEQSRKDLEAAFPQITEEKIQLEVGNALIAEDTAAGELDKAATVVSTLLASRPTDAALLFMSYRIYTDLADKAVVTLALSDPDSAQMHQLMARELTRQGDKSAAIANYREALRIDPKLPGLHSELGMLLYYSSEDKPSADAEAELKAALAANPKDTRAEVMLGVIAEKRGDVNAAYAAFSHALEMDPNNSDACTELAKVLVTMNQHDKAQQMFERVLQIDPTNYVAHYRLSTLYREAGKTDQAKAQVAEYLKYKQMNTKLQKIFHNMRSLSGESETDNQDGK
jgi:cytochrome c-type biogenesis protein CcmH/NrfG